MDQLFTLFLQQVNPKTPSASAAYLREASAFVTWLAERGLTLEAARPNDLQRYLATLTAQFQPSTAARKFSVVRRFCAVLKEQGKLKANPAALVAVSLAGYRPRSRGKPSLEKLWTIPTTTMQGVRDGAILRLAAFGLSQAQIAGLNVADVDATAQAIRLRRRTTRRMIQPLDPDTFAALRRWLALRQMLNPADPAVFVSLHWTSGRTTPHQRISQRGLFDVLRRHRR
jgi:site-specific recombinase XerC